MTLKNTKKNWAFFEKINSPNLGPFLVKNWEKRWFFGFFQKVPKPLFWPVLALFCSKNHPNWVFARKWVPLTKNLKSLRPKLDLGLPRWALGPPKLDFWPKMSAPYKKSCVPQTQTLPRPAPMGSGPAQTGLLAKNGAFLPYGVRAHRGHLDIRLAHPTFGPMN